MEALVLFFFLEVSIIVTVPVLVACQVSLELPGPLTTALDEEWP